MFKCLAGAHVVGVRSRCAPSLQWIVVDSRAGAVNMGGFYDWPRVQARKGLAHLLDAEGCHAPPTLSFTGMVPTGPWIQATPARAASSILELHGSGSFTWLSKQARRASGRAASSSPIDDAYVLVIACCL